MSGLRKALVFAALGLASPAFAAEDAQPAGADDIAALQRFASCVVEHARPEAEAMVESDFREETYAAARRRFAVEHRRCLGSEGELRMSGMLFAGAIAEALLRDGLTESELRARLRPSEPALESRSTGEYTGLCMALTHPAETAALVYSDPVAAESDAPLATYAQGLPQCVQQGQQLRINKPGLRALAALAAYRIAERGATLQEAAE